jgi:hypothetical protein
MDLIKLSASWENIRKHISIVLEFILHFLLAKATTMKWGTMVAHLLIIWEEHE